MKTVPYEIGDIVVYNVGSPEHRETRYVLVEEIDPDCDGRGEPCFAGSLVDPNTFEPIDLQGKPIPWGGMKGKVGNEPAVFSVWGFPRQIKRVALHKQDFAEFHRGAIEKARKEMERLYR